MDGNPISPITTDATGFYEFVNLRPGGYKVRFVPPVDYEFVTPNGGADNVDSDAVVQTDGSGLSQCVTLVSVEDDPTIDAGVFLAVPDCDVTVEKTCQVIPPPTPGDFVCSDAKPLDVLTMILAEDREIAEIRYYKATYDPSKSEDDNLPNLIGVIDGPIVLGDEVAAAGYAAANATNDVDWVITFADGSQEISRFHRSCSDSEMNGPEDCGKLEGDGKSNVASIWPTSGSSRASPATAWHSTARCRIRSPRRRPSARSRPRPRRTAWARSRRSPSVTSTTTASSSRTCRTARRSAFCRVTPVSQCGSWSVTAVPGSTSTPACRAA